MLLWIDVGDEDCRCLQTLKCNDAKLFCANHKQDGGRCVAIGTGAPGMITETASTAASLLLSLSCAAILFVASVF